MKSLKLNFYMENARSISFVTENCLQNLVKNFDVYEFKVIPFKPKIGDKYWWVEVDGKVCSDIFERGCTFDCMAMAIGNCFRTKESAEAHKEKILKILKGEGHE